MYLEQINTFPDMFRCEVSGQMGRVALVWLGDAAELSAVSKPRNGSLLDQMCSPQGRGREKESGKWTVLEQCALRGLWPVQLAHVGV